MATAAPTKGQKAKQVALYPLDWLEERSGLVGATKYFLFRKVPGDVNWYQTLGSATLTAFLVQAMTGVILAMYYTPDPNSAYESIKHITNDVTLGWLVRGMHRWGASLFIILMFFHMARVFLFGAYKYPRELNWIIGVLLLTLGMLEGFTGYLLPWDQTAYTLARFYSIHMLILPGAIIALIGLHLYLVIRLGVTSPPWSKTAAGAPWLEDEAPEQPARKGLVNPEPRNGAER
jgi:ubiquinol-cytochrome c reductase cytochrome b subunit/menaquinol-cytochrome c reductase cytochrome b subunit